MNGSKRDTEAMTNNKCSTTMDEHVTEMEFDPERIISTMKNKTLWIIIMMILVILPDFCYRTLQGSFLNIYSHFITRCRISQLEEKNWSFEQIQSIIAPHGDFFRNCTYYNFDYDIVAKMEYPDALKYTMLEFKPSVKFCDKFVHSGNSSLSVYQDFSLVCSRKLYADILDISPEYGRMFGQLLLVPYGDHFGRKRVMQWGWNIIAFGALITPLTNDIETPIIGRFLSGMGYSAIQLPLQAIIIEISSIQSRPYRFLMTNIGVGVSWIVSPFIIRGFHFWRNLHWALASFLLLIPLLIWYIPESPSWFLSKKMKAKAWNMLNYMTDPEKQEELLLKYRSEKSQTMKICGDCKELKAFLKPQLWPIIAVGAICGCVHFKSLFERFMFPLYVSRSTSFIVFGATEIISNLLSMCVLTRWKGKLPIAISFMLSSLGYFAAFASKEGTVENFLSIIMIDIATSSAYNTISLFIAEISPTSYRCTCTGILGGVTIIVGTALTYHFHHMAVEKTRALLILLSIVSFVGSIVSYFIPKAKEEDIYNTTEETSRTY